MVQSLFKAISKLVKNKETKSSDYGFTKGKSCLNSPVASYNEIASLVDKRRVMDDVYLEF